MDDPGPRTNEPDRVRNGSATLENTSVIRTHVQHLLSDDFQLRTEAADKLTHEGAPAALLIIAKLTDRSTPSQTIPTLAHTLEKIGPAAVPAILEWLDQVPETRTAEEGFLVETFVGILGTIQDRRMVPTLQSLLGKLNRRIERNHNRLLVEVCQATRVRIHRILSQIGERAALEDLLCLLGDGRTRVRDGIVQSLARIGDRRALAPLARLHGIESGVSLSGAQQIRESFREIFRRESADAQVDVVRSWSEQERPLLEPMLPKSRNGNGH